MSTTASTAHHQRPSILGTDARRFWNLMWTLAVTDFKLRFYGSVLGYTWTLVRPFALFGVLYVVFALIVHGTRQSGGVIEFPHTLTLERS